jgi:chromosome segregation protein
MVKIEKLVMQGFKSFQRKVSVPFPTGFSVVTGPNGSGKSNILDSICFVLGKTSAKTLRAKKSENLIFHGSRKKKGSDFASVALHFDNRDRALPVKEDVATISRKLNKKGVSTYRLNGRVVTRQQILDVFSQAHIHPDGHNIIRQGDVNRIVEMDAVERRGMIDEISGIMEYDEKKEKAGKELERIEEKLREAGLLLREKGSIMGKMKSDYEAALSYQKLQKEFEAVGTALVMKSFSDAEGSLDDVKRRLEEKEKESGKLEKEIEKYDAEYAEEEKKLESLTKELMKASSQIEVTKRLARLQADVRIIRERMESNRAQVERLQGMVERLSSMDRRASPAVKAVSGFKGVRGTLSELIRMPGEYGVAIEVAAGSHLADVVVDTTSNAVMCVKHLKKDRIGRARFLPLDKIKLYAKKPLPPGAIGWLSDLVKYEARFKPAVEYVLGTTVCVKDIDKAKGIAKTYRVRIVTLDGDLVEASGAITGGYYRKKSMASDVNKYIDEKKRLARENEELEKRLKDMNEDMEILAEKEKGTKSFSLEKDRMRFDERMGRIREKRKDAYEKRLVIQQELNKLNISRARIEARFDNANLQLKEMDKKKGVARKELKELLGLKVSSLKEKERNITDKINMLGAINMKALEEFGSIKESFDEFKEKVDKIAEEKGVIEDTINEIEGKRKGTFTATLKEIAKHFRDIYSELTGGEAEMNLEVPDNIESGLAIRASPSGKRLLHIDSLSGGEKTLTAFAFLFAIQRHKPSPFYVLDEADATLDKANTKRVVDLIKKQAQGSQFIIISHNDQLIKEADQVYGISMLDGESKMMGLKLPKRNN